MQTPLRIAFGLLVLTTLAQAQQKTWCIQASGAEVVPPVSTMASATAVFTLDQTYGVLSWEITYQNLTGANTGMHLHGPAGIGSNAGIQIDLGTGSPNMGSAVLTTSQVAMLNSGMMYLLIHSMGFPGGELRGQVDDVCVKTICTSQPNSFDGTGARLEAVGSFAAADNALMLFGEGVPPGQFGMLLIGKGSTQVMPPGSSGLLCISGAPIGRFNHQILTADMAGILGPFTPDLSSLPNPPGGTVMAGDKWNFQAWFRDAGNTSNFTDALRITFQ